jgi:hypothetical protein
MEAGLVDRAKVDVYARLLEGHDIGNENRKALVTAEGLENEPFRHDLKTGRNDSEFAVFHVFTSTR